MPISSHQVSGYIGGQQAMFGNFASYSQQISPGGPHGPTPGYANPMAGVHEAPTNPLMMPGSEDIGTRSISAMGNIGLPALGTAAMIGGSFLPGMLGRGIGMLDPFSAGLSGFARGAGLRAGGQGIMANMGRIASGGIGSIARAGLSGLGGAALAAAPMMALGQVAHYGVGQMVQGAQFEGQVGNALNQNFRQLNSMSETGFGFGKQGVGQIADVVREMGNKEMMSSPQEMLRLMQAGTGMGVFRAVQDAKQFKTKFQEMVGALKEVATTMNTTLEGAVPFLQQARQMGFWTPQDISRHAQMTKQTAAATGMSSAQAQQMMSQGAQMARSIGARGYAGAEGMARTMQLVGGAVRGGSISEEQLAEVTGGLQGPEAIQAMAGTMQAASTRFASGTTARWLLAGLGRNKFQNLDQGKLSQFLSGNMGIGEIGSSARRNVGGQGAFNFVMNERRLREELVRRGPEAQFGLVRGLVGGSLYDESSRGQYVSRRLMQRYFGVSGEQADMMAKLARDMPRITRENQQRSGALADQEARNRDQLMNESYEGIKRKAMDWWRKTVSDPLQKIGADVAREVGHAYEDVGNKLFGTAQSRYRFRGIERGAMQALQMRAMGSEKEYTQQFASQQEMQQFTKNRSGGGGLSMWARSGIDPGAILQETAGQMFNNMPVEVQERVRQSLAAAQTGDITERSSKALGFQGAKEAKSAVSAAQKEMSGSEFQMKSFQIAQRTGLKGMELAQKMVEEIEGGRLGGGALKQLVAGGGTQAAFRLAAAQTDQARGETGGIDLSDMAKTLGVAEGMSKRELETAASRDLESAEHIMSFAATANKKWYQTNFSQGDVAATLEKGGADLREALTMFGAGKTPEEKATNMADARKKIAVLARDKGKFSDRERDMLLAMTGDPSHPGATLMQAAMLQYGVASRRRNTLATADQVQSRMGRFRASLGKQREKIMEGLDRISSPGGESLGTIVRQLTTGTASGEAFQERIGQLVTAASSTDPEQAARAAELLRGFEGGEVFVSAIEEGARVGHAAKALTSRRGGINKRTMAAQVFAASMGVDQISTQELKALEAGGAKADKAQAAILGRLGDVKPEMKERAKEMLQAIRDKDQTKLVTLGRSSAAARSLGLMGDPSADIFAQKVKEMRPTSTAGEGHGSPKGMHITLIKIASLLGEIKEKGKGKDLNMGEDETK